MVSVRAIEQQAGYLVELRDGPAEAWYWTCCDSRGDHTSRMRALMGLRGHWAVAGHVGQAQSG